MSHPSVHAPAAATDNAADASPSRLGARLARVVRGALWLTVCVCLMPTTACLVTDAIEFDQQPNHPPSIVYVADDPNTPAPGDLLWVDLSGTQSNWEFDVLIRDDNIEDELEVHQRMMRDGASLPRFTSSMLPPSGSVERRYTVRFTVGDLRQGECQRLEIAVSGSFVDRDDGQFFDFALDDDDIAYAAWTILEGAGEPPVTPEDEARIARLLETCPSEDVLLMMEPEPGTVP